MQSSDGSERNTVSEHNGSAIHAIAFLPDGSQLVSAGDDNRIVQWGLSTTSSLQTFSTDDSPRAVTVSPDETRLAAVTESGVVTVWDIETGDSVQTFSDESTPVNDLNIGETGNLLFVAHDDGRTLIYNHATGNPEATLTDHTLAVEAVVPMAGNDELLTGSRDGTVHRWDISALTDTNVSMWSIF